MPFVFHKKGLNGTSTLKLGEIIFIGMLDPYAGDITPDDIDNDPNLYLFIETPSSSEAYEWMVEFAERIEVGKLAEKLPIALDGKGAFHRFRNVLSDYPEQREMWRKFEDTKINSEIEEWVRRSGIEPDNPPPRRNKANE